MRWNRIFYPFEAAVRISYVYKFRSQITGKEMSLRY